MPLVQVGRSSRTEQRLHSRIMRPELVPPLLVTEHYVVVGGSSGRVNLATLNRLFPKTSKRWIVVIVQRPSVPHLVDTLRVRQLRLDGHDTDNEPMLRRCIRSAVVTNRGSRSSKAAETSAASSS